MTSSMANPVQYTISYGEGLSACAVLFIVLINTFQDMVLLLPTKYLFHPHHHF